MIPNFRDQLFAGRTVKKAAQDKQIKTAEKLGAWHWLSAV
jgi:hypothetical protein